MDANEMFDKILDVVKYPLRKANETWDQMDGVWQVGIWAALMIIGIFFIPSFFLFIGVAVVAVQRIGFHLGFFTDEYDEPAVPEPPSL